MKKRPFSIKASEEQKALWEAAALEERCSLGEFIRRAADARAAGAARAVRPDATSPIPVVPDETPPARAVGAPAREVQRTKKGEPCGHRVPSGTYCKMCGEVVS